MGADKNGKQLRDKEGKPRRVQSVRGAWLLYGGFASSGHKCIELHDEAISRRTRPLKRRLSEAAGKAAAAAAGAPGPRSDNGVDDSDPEAVIPLDSPRSMDGTSLLHIEEVD